MILYKKGGSMKKSLKVLMLQCIFLSQVLFSFIVIPVVLVPVVLIVYAIDKMVTDCRREATEKANRYTRWKMHSESIKGETLSELEKKVIPTSLQESIRESIDAILNDKIIYKGSDYPLFPTANLKIFVLKNIQDFFNLEHDVLNQFVYEESIRTIRNLEGTLNFVPEMEIINGKEYEVEGKGKFVDRDSTFKKIDELHTEYMEKYDLSMKRLKYMEEIAKTDKAQFEKLLNSAIERVKNGLSKVIRDFANKIYYESKGDYQSEQMITELSPQYIAHLSILAYLMYWRAQPQRTLSAADKEEKLGLVKAKNIYVENLKEEYQSMSSKQPEEKKISKPTNRANLAKVLGAQSLRMKLSDQPIEKAKHKQASKTIDEELAQFNKTQQQPVQQSLWSRVKSWFGW